MSNSTPEFVTVALDDSSTASLATMPLSSNALTSFGRSSTTPSAMTVITSMIVVTAAAANGLVLFVMISDGLITKNVTNLLICNQTLLDGIACITKAVHVILQQIGALDNQTGIARWMICFALDTHTVMTSAVYSAQAGLVAITLERYVKVVHPIWHRNKYRRWMTILGMVLPWLNGIITKFVPNWATLAVVSNKCMRLWPSQALAKGYTGALFFWQFVLPVMVFGYCYCQIVRVIRRQATVSSEMPLSALEKPQPSTSAHTQSFKAQHQNEQQMSRTEKNVIKTTIVVIVSYVVCWYPTEIFHIVVFYSRLRPNAAVYSSTSMVAFAALLLNPVIYGAHFNVFSRAFKRLFKTDCGSSVSGVATGVSTAEASARRGR